MILCMITTYSSPDLYQEAHIFIYLVFVFKYIKIKKVCFGLHARLQLHYNIPTCITVKRTAGKKKALKLGTVATGGGVWDSEEGWCLRSHRRTSGCAEVDRRCRVLRRAGRS